MLFSLQLVHTASSVAWEFDLYFSFMKFQLKGTSLDGVVLLPSKIRYYIMLHFHHYLI